MRHAALVGAAALVCGSAWAQPEKERARGLLREGLDAYAAHDFPQALAKFEEAYRAFPSPKLLVNIGAAYRELGKPVEALEHYERFFRDAGPDVDAAFRAEAQRDADALRDRVGEVEVRAPPGARVTIDGRDVAPGVVRVEAGRHAVTIGSHREETSVRGRARVVVTRPAEPPAPVAPAPEPAPAPLVTPEPAGGPPVAEVRARPRRLFYTWIAAGTTAALAIGGAVAFLSARSAFGDLPDACGDDGCSEAEAEPVRSRLLLTNVLFGVAGAAAVATGVLWWWETRPVEVGAAPSGAFVRGRF